MSEGMVKIKAGKEEISLRLGWGAMRQFEKATGKNSLKVVEDLQDPVNARSPVDDIVTLFWCMMIPRPQTIEEAEEILEEIPMPKLMDVLNEAASLAFGADDELEEDKDPKNEK